MKRKQRIKSIDPLEEISSLEKKVLEDAPDRGYIPPLSQKVAFRALPISHTTLRGLEEASPPFTTMTDIQNACIPHALAGRDILGAARTGSGKTLAFLIPTMEKLYRERVGPEDGPSAVILSPTRELAMQIFQVLRKVGKHHSFSVGLLIGGRKDFYLEQQHIGSTNVLIATPGRLLQHLEQTAYFDLSNLKVLVLDEADRILDMGFRADLTKILEYIPTDNRQTMLFSATQTRDVSLLARLSLSKPEYIGVHDKERTSTPETLDQTYIVVPVEHKLDAIYSFIKTHLKTKTIIFLASCAQVRYAWEVFCSIRPGTPIMALHGKLVQEKRTQIYFDFLQRPSAVLFATDIASRGLDFKGVDWVVQADAPEDRDMYVHRVGRTARFKSGGKALLMLTEAEEKNGFVDIIQGKSASKIPLKKLSINPSKTLIVTERASGIVASNVKVHELAKKAFHSYVRSVHLMPLKNIFRVKDLDLDGLAKSLGLASTPTLKFLDRAPKDREELRKNKNVNRKLQKLKEQIKAEKLAKRIAKLGQTAAPLVDTEANVECADAGDKLLISKRKHSSADEDSSLDEPEAKSLKIGTTSSGKHIRFDDAGNEETFSNLLQGGNSATGMKDVEQGAGNYLARIQQRLRENASLDREEENRRIRDKHRKRRLQEKEERADAPETVAILGSPNESTGSSSDDTSDSSDLEGDDHSTSLGGQEELALSLIRKKS